MTIQAWSIPVPKSQQVQQVQQEVERVKILTGKYKGKVRDLCHLVGDNKVVVHVDVCKNVTYNKSSVEFVESEYVLVTEFY